MGTKTNILIIEKDLRDARRLMDELELQRFEPTCVHVDSFEAFRKHLSDEGLDLILSEASVPGLNAFHALELARSQRPEVPFIFVTRNQDPGLLVEMFENGGHGHVAKHRLSELGLVIRQAQENVREDRQRRDAPPERDQEVSGDVEDEKDASPSGATPPRSVCPRCKRIAGSRGRWEDLEIYLRRHRQAKVALGTCPECAHAAGHRGIR